VHHPPVDVETPAQHRGEKSFIGEESTAFLVRTDPAGVVEGGAGEDGRGGVRGFSGSYRFKGKEKPSEKEREDYPGPDHFESPEGPLRNRDQSNCG
jgi:hypothetical protein